MLRIDTPRLVRSILVGELYGHNPRPITIIMNSEVCWSYHRKNLAMECQSDAISNAYARWKLQTEMWLMYCVI